MSEEEKELVEKFNNLYIKEFKGETITDDDRLNYIECALITNLIEKLDKELNSLKEIEKSHQEENGKLKIELGKEKEKNTELRIKISARETVAEELKKELEQEKEKNKELEEKLKIAKQLYNDACVCIATDCVEKDKIKEMMKYREFELQQEYKEFEEDVEWRIYKKILEDR